MLNISVEHRQRGQPGPYQPHTYESRITVESTGWGDGLTEQQMRRLAKAVVQWWPEDEERADGMSGHFQPRLRRMERIERESDGPARREVWIVRVEIPYTD